MTSAKEAGIQRPAPEGSVQGHVTKLLQQGNHSCFLTSPMLLAGPSTLRQAAQCHQERQERSGRQPPPPTPRAFFIMNLPERPARDSARPSACLPSPRHSEGHTEREGSGARTPNPHSPLPLGRRAHRQMSGPRAEVLTSSLVVTPGKS